MALFDASDLLQRAKNLLNRPVTDEAFTVTTTDDVWYQFLDNGQRRVVQMVATQFPDQAYGAPTLLTTSDGGATYVFGNDADGNPIIPIGQIELRASKTGVSILPGSDWDDTTDVYLLDTGGATIRWPGQRTRTFTNGPWCRFITPPTQITGSSSTIGLKPFPLRELIAIDAARQGALRLGVDPGPYTNQFDVRWYELTHLFRTQMYGQGMVSNTSGGSSPWWRRGAY